MTFPCSSQPSLFSAHPSASAVCTPLSFSLRPRTRFVLTSVLSSPELRHGITPTLNSGDFILVSGNVNLGDIQQDRSRPACSFSRFSDRHPSLNSLIIVVSALSRMHRLRSRITFLAILPLFWAVEGRGRAKLSLAIWLQSLA